MKESSRVDIEVLNGEQAWIIISDGKTQMLHSDTRLTKASPLKYLESFLSEYSPECKDKWIVLDQGSKLYGNAKIKISFEVLDIRFIPPVLTVPMTTDLLREHTERFCKELKLY